MGSDNRDQVNEKTGLIEDPSKDMIERDSAADIMNQILYDTDLDIRKVETISMPIEGLAALGTAVASMLPSMRTITTTMQFNTDGLFRIANSAPGDVLKMAKDGNAWGAIKTATGSSKMAKLSAAGPLEASSSTIIPPDPATLAMAVVLYSIEQKLDSILEMEKQILSFLENEKESQIEADIKILAESITQYKYNWKKDLYLQGHYKQALDIKRTAEKNIRSYQKDIQDWNVANTPIVMNAKVNAGVKSLLKKFKYYRLSLYIYSLASLVEVMMLKDFQEEHLNRIKKDIENRSLAYRELYTERSKQIGKAAGGALEANVLKNMGNVGKAFGGFIGGIPFVKEGPVDEWLQDGGSALSKNAENMETDVVKMLAAVKDPGTKVFAEKIDDLNRIYNHTSEICFDKDKIYLIAK